jgi:hypothetical protein
MDHVSPEASRGVARWRRSCSAAAASDLDAMYLLLQPLEVIVDDQSKLTLHGLVQHYVMLLEAEKNRRLNDLLDMLDFNQVTPLFSRSRLFTHSWTARTCLLASSSRRASWLPLLLPCSVTLSNT